MYLPQIRQPRAFATDANDRAGATPSGTPACAVQVTAGKNASAD